MLSLLLSAGWFCACSNDGGEDFNGKGSFFSGGEGSSDKEAAKNPTETNVLFVQNSSPIYSVNISISSSKMTNFNDLKAGDYFDSSAISFYIVSDNPQNTTGTGYTALLAPPPLLSGQVLVVDKKTIDKKSYITLSLQDLKIHSDQDDCDYTFNALVDFEVDPNRTMAINDRRRTAV